MDILVVADGHYYQNTLGEVFADSVFDYKFYSRYLSVFDNVYALIRLDYVNKIPYHAKKASGDKVHFLALPPTTGVIEYVKNYLKTKRLVRKYIKHFDSAIIRMPGVVANLAWNEFRKTKKPYAIEVVVDPWEYFAPGTIKSFSRPFVQIMWTAYLKKACKEANGVSYVTEEYLQKKYPCRALIDGSSDCYFTASYSSVELPDDEFALPKQYTKKDKYIISHVAASFTSYGKGHLTLMKAAKEVIDKGFNIEVWFIGDGPLREKFESFANELGIEKSIKFLGLLSSGRTVRDKLRESDLFVFPTRAEGLPRVVLEAMSVGLPVISSPICGIPEIIPQDCLIDYDDYNGFAKNIIFLIDHPNVMSAHSKQSINTAKKNSSVVLNEKRSKFYNLLLDIKKR